MKNLITNIVTWYKADKGKKFYKRRWFYTLLILLVIKGFSGNTKDTTTTAPTNSKINSATQAKTALKYANDEISMGISGEQAIKSVMGGGVTRQEAITAINIVNAQQKTAKTKEKIANTKAIATAKVQTNKMDTNILYYSQIKAKSVFGNRFTKAEIDDGGIIIYFKLSDNLSMKMVGTGGFLDASKMFALYKGKTKNYTDVTCIGSYPVKDKYGNQSNQNIFALTLTNSTIQKINFNNIDPTTDLVPLSSSHGINPQLTK